jgi:hypothetical protein
MDPVTENIGGMRAWRSMACMMDVEWTVSRV